MLVKEIIRKTTRVRRVLFLTLVFLLSFSGVVYAIGQVDKPTIDSGQNSTIFVEDNFVPTTYYIKTENDLKALRSAVSAGNDFVNDIIEISGDLVFSNWEPIGSKEHPFRGTLDGNGYVLKIQNNLPLFAFVENAKLKNIVVEYDFLPEETIPGNWLYTKGNAGVKNCTQKSRGKLMYERK